MSRDHFRTTLLAAALAATGAAIALPISSQAAGTYGAMKPAGSGGTSAGTAKSSLSPGDRKFMTSAAEGGIAQVEFGTLAQRKGKAAASEVKQFGQQMVDDRSRADSDLRQIAEKKGIALPIQMDASSQREYDKLVKLSGAAFDREYMRLMVADHEKDIRAFQKAERSAKDTDLRTFAKDALPTLEENLKLAEFDQVAIKTEARSGAKS